MLWIFVDSGGKLFEFQEDRQAHEDSTGLEGPVGR